jgi:hypothetical protein
LGYIIGFLSELGIVPTLIGRGEDAIFSGVITMSDGQLSAAARAIHLAN